MLRDSRTEAVGPVNISLMAAPPSTMRAVHVRAYDGKPESLTVMQVPVPHPGPGEVLIRVFASPINPSDLLFIRGLYAFQKPVPIIPGFEGSGTVIEAGSGAMPRFLRNRKVACTTAAPHISSGMWAEYAVTSAQLCVPLREGITLEQGATMLINPLTAWALLDEARSGGHRAVVQTAAASALGRMIVRLARRFSVAVINVVRRPEQVALLHRIGAEHVLNSNDQAFAANLRQLCHEVRATLAFDAVGNELSLLLLRALPNGSRLVVYGALSLSPCQADPSSLIFEDKRVEGFYLSSWLQRKSFLTKLRLARQVQQLLPNELKTEIQSRTALEEVAQAIHQSSTNGTAGKILLGP